jgi:hypothetical protein
MDQWFCDIAGREIGPLSPEQLRAMAAKGQILPSDCVRRGVEGTWVLARQVKGLFPTPPPVSPHPLGEGQGVRAAGQAAPPPSPLANAEATAEIGFETPSDMFPPEAAADAPGAFSFDSEPASPAADLPARSSTPIPVLASIRRRQQQDRKKMMIGLLLLGIVALVIASLSLALRSSEQQSGEPGGSAADGAGKARPEKAATKAGEKSLKESTPAGKPVTEAADQHAAKPAAADDHATKSAAVATWVDASQSPATVGDVSVKIAIVAKTPSRPGKTDEERLLIGIEVRNTDATRKVDFSGWASDGIARGARLTDNFGNVYKPMPLGRLAVAGSRLPMSIYPNQSGREVLAFEPPIAKAEFLRLELSAVAFGKDDVVRLTIPAKMIAERSDLIEPKGAKPSGSGDASKKAAKKPHAPRPGTPEGDFGIGEDDAPQ